MLRIELESGEHFRQIADNLSIVLALANADLSQFLYVNKAYEQIWGQSVESLYADSMSFVQPVCAEDRGRLRDALRGLVNGEPITGIECRLLRPNGAMAWVLCRGFPVFDGDGRIIRLVGSAEDITERKLAEEKLQRAYSRTEAVLQTIHDAYVLLDRQWHFLCVNRAALQGMGRSEEEIAGRTLWELFPDIEGTELGFQCRWSMEKRTPATVEFYYAPRDAWWENRFYPVDEGLAVFAADISERKKAEGVLRESEDRYRDLVEHSSDLICTHNPAGILLSINEPPLRILGYTREEMLGRPLREFVTPEAKPHCDEYLERIRRDGSASGLLPVVTKNGDVRLWEFNNSLRSAGVRSPIVRGIAHDVTEQKRAEAALRRSEEKFAKAFRSSPAEMVIVTLNEGRLVEVNETCTRVLGYNREELIGRTSLELGLWVDPAERDALLEDVKENGRALDHVVRLRAKSGAIGYKRYSAELVHIGKEPCVLGVGVDITESRRIQETLRRSEEFLAEGQRLSHTGSWSWNPHTGEMFWSRQMYRMIGLAPGTKATMELVSRYLHPDERPVFEQAVRRLLEDQSDSEGDYRIVLDNGSTRHVHCMARPVFGLRGELLEFIGTAMDVTEQKKAEGELRRLSGQLLRLHDEERRSIARDLHDTTGQGLVALTATLTQLHSIVPSSNRRGRKLLAESEALVKECLREVRTLSYVLYPPMLEQAGLEDAIRHFRDGFAARTGIAVKLDIPRGLGRLGRDVELALFRVTQESLANVQRHSGSSSVEVLIHQHAGVVDLEVNDQGRGIEKTKNSDNGEFPFPIGVGIASMKERIKQVGGRLQIRSDSSGTKVRATVPMHG